MSQAAGVHLQRRCNCHSCSLDITTLTEVAEVVHRLAGTHDAVALLTERGKGATELGSRDGVRVSGERHLDNGNVGTACKRDLEGDPDAVVEAALGGREADV